MLEKYETPEVEFVEMEEEDVMCASSGCTYGDVVYTRDIPACVP